jgi:hypothetical protein
MGGSSKPKAPPPAPPPPSETSLDVQQEVDATKKRAGKRQGRQSTVLNEQVNPAGGNTVLG